MAREAAARVDEKLKDQPPTQPELFETHIEAEGADDDDVEVVIKPEPKVAAKAKTEPTVDPTEALQEQIKALKESERLANERAEKAATEARTERERYESDLTRSRMTTEQAQLETIETAMTAAQSDAENAERDMMLAIQAGDAKAQAEAQRRISKAEAYLGRLEDGKIELERQIETAKVRAETKKNEPPKQEDPIAAMNLPPKAQEWLRGHPEYASDNRKNIKLQAAHWDALDEGHRAFSTEYFEAVETLLGLRKAETPLEDQPVERPVISGTKRTTIVSAPVSREVPSGGAPRKSKVELTAEEHEIAKASGITDTEYARQKIKLSELKANGHYGDR